VSAPASRIEVQKLAHDLGVEPKSLDYLASVPAAELATLRHGVSRAIFAANEERIRPLGALARRVPPALAAKVAKAALGPLLCGRVASVISPRTAVPLAAHLDPDFLARVTLSLDPTASAAIIKELDDELVVGVGKRLLDAGEYMVLARFITVVDEQVLLALVDLAEGVHLLEVAVYAEDQERVDELLQVIPEPKLLAIVEAAATDTVRAHAAVSLIAMLGPESQRRLADLAAGLSEQAADAVVGAISRLQMWPQLLPIVASLSPEAIGAFVNVPTLLEAEVVDDLIATVRTAGEDEGAGRLPFRVLLDVLELFDEPHRAMLGRLTQLDDLATVAWAARSTGTTEEQVREAIGCLLAGEPLPAPFRTALARS
jgi:hypothetical protein